MALLLTPGVCPRGVPQNRSWKVAKGSPKNSLKPTREIPAYKALDLQDVFPIYSEQLPAYLRLHRRGPDEVSGLEIVESLGEPPAQPRRQVYLEGMLDSTLSSQQPV